MGAGAPGGARRGVLEKVTAFITRGEGAAQELLVFRHPTAGIQLPAGTVEAEESVETAALREVREETGLIDIAVIARIGFRPETLEPAQRMVLRDAPLRQAPDPDAPHLEYNSRVDPRLRRGYTVRQTAAQGNAVQVVYEESGLLPNGAAVIRFVEGWIDADAVTQAIERHFFHLTPTAPTPEKWVQSAEEKGQEFQLYWTPLAGDPDLIPLQAVWLAEFQERLRRS